VPTVIASPFTHGNPDSNRVSSLLFDHTSVLRLIEWRWGLKPLTPRDASSDLFNLAYALSFSHPDSTVPNLPQPSAPLIAAPCLQALPGALLNGISPSAVWTKLGKLAAQHGFAVKDVG
jgi:phospholipase C